MSSAAGWSRTRDFDGSDRRRGDRPCRHTPTRRGRHTSRLRPSRYAMSTTDTAHAIRPFRVDIPDDALDDLRRRIAATRWPTPELVADRSQGVQQSTLRNLARFWETAYDW